MEDQENQNQAEATLAVARVAGSRVKLVYAQFLLPIAILLAALIISGTIFYTRGSSDGGGAQVAGTGNNQPEKPVEINIGSEDHVLGNKNAKIEIVEFSDFQCPFCRSFWSDTFVQIKKDYVDTGKAKFVYKHFPLSFHPAAHVSAEAAECAADQNKFWEMHDKMFGEQEKLGQGTIQYDKPEIQKWAGQIGLNMTQFNQCLDSGKYVKRVDDDFAYGSQVGVSGTPTTFVNGQRIVGAQPFASFKAIIDPLLK
ncbi:MAG: DsbA family protein [Candidatus Yanofskybacteria bacterium]|nr:DsbA family protein [Candidatus Yanofskybacteria bacterium]